LAPGRVGVAVDFSQDTDLEWQGNQMAAPLPSTATADRTVPDPLPSSRRVRRPLVWFFVLAYALSWAWVIPWAATGHTVYQGQGWPTHLPSLLGPLVAAFVLTLWTRRAEGARELLSRMVRWRFGKRWWLVVLSPLAFLAIALAGVAALGTLPARREFGEFTGVPSGFGIVGMALIVLLVNGFGEETGWRGYALPRLQRQFTPLRATLIVALLWACWHLPQFFFLDSYRGFSAPMLPVFVLGLTCGAVVCTWIYNGTGGSVLAVAVWHGLYNVTGGTKAATSGSGAISAIVWTLVVANAVVLVVMERRARRRGRPSVLLPA
jgi:uncharacterized protein